MDPPIRLHPVCQPCFRNMMYFCAAAVGENVRQLLDPLTCNYSELDSAWFRQRVETGSNWLFTQTANVRYQPLTFLPHFAQWIEADDGGSRPHVTHHLCYVETMQLAMAHTEWIAPAVRSWGPLGPDCDADVVTDEHVRVFIAAFVLHWFNMQIRPRSPTYSPTHGANYESLLILS